METNISRNDEPFRSMEINTSSDEDPFQVEARDFTIGNDSRNNFL